MIQPSKLAVILKFYSQKINSLNKQGWNSIHKQSKWKASWRKSLRLVSTFKASCYIEILFTKKQFEKQGQNSIHKQSKWKASWRNSIWLIAFGTLYGIFLYLFTVEHNLSNALNVEANSDFNLKLYFFGVFVDKNGQKTSPLNRFVPI